MKLVLLLVVAVASSPLDSPETAVQTSEHKETGETVEGKEAGADRDEKLFSVFQIVKFNNEECTAVDGLMGTCYTGAECTNLGGEERGKCASGFGVCCVSVVDPNCPVTIMLNNSYIVNPGYPNNLDTAAACASTGASSRINPAASRLFFPGKPTTTTTTPASTSGTVTFPKAYTYTINKASSSVVQFRLDFIDFDIAGPLNGDCTNETLSITGVDAVTSKVLPTNLCGILTGQHIYLSVKDVTTVTITITITGARSQSWTILVRQYEADQTDYLAPRGCLQFFREDAATFSTFNHQSGAGELLNNHMYSVCIEQSDLYCDVSLTSSSFDLTKDATTGSCSDSVAFGTSVFCGSTFANLGTLLWNYTGQYQVPLFSDGNNDANAIGYEISYILLPC